MKIGITETIDCAHHLPGHPKCGPPHGHTYRVDLTLEGATTGGMVMDFGDAKKVLRSVLMEHDHGDWNSVLELPTVENIAVLLKNRLERETDKAITLRVWEGADKWAEL